MAASCAMPTKGSFFAPSLFLDVGPASTVVQEEIFGPVAVAMTFRTPEEAVQLANHTRYGLAATVWSENLNLALDTAARVKAGVVWVNSTNLFDAAAGFGGYKESGFGREGGREGMYEYLQADWLKDVPQVARQKGPAHFQRACQSAERLSTERPSSLSAASRRGPTPAIPIP